MQRRHLKTIRNNCGRPQSYIIWTRAATYVHRIRCVGDQPRPLIQSQQHKVHSSLCLGNGQAETLRRSAPTTQTHGSSYNLLAHCCTVSCCPGGGGMRILSNRLLGTCSKMSSNGGGKISSHCFHRSVQQYTLHLGEVDAASASAAVPILLTTLVSVTQSDPTRATST